MVVQRANGRQRRCRVALHCPSSPCSVTSPRPRHGYLSKGVTVREDLVNEHLSKPTAGHFNRGCFHAGFLKVRTAFSNHRDLHPIRYIGQPHGQADEAIWRCPTLFNGQGVFHEMMRRVPFIFCREECVRANFQSDSKIAIGFVGQRISLPNRSRTPLASLSSATMLTSASPNNADKKRKIIEMARVPPRIRLNSFVAEELVGSNNSAMIGSSSGIVLRLWVGVAVLEHTPGPLPWCSKNNPQRHPLRG